METDYRAKCWADFLAEVDPHRCVLCDIETPNPGIFCYRCSTLSPENRRLEMWGHRVGTLIHMRDRGRIGNWEVLSRQNGHERLCCRAIDGKENVVVAVRNRGDGSSWALYAVDNTFEDKVVVLGCGWLPPSDPDRFNKIKMQADAMVNLLSVGNPIAISPEVWFKAGFIADLDSEGHYQLWDAEI